MKKKLYCSPDKKICGVCAGMADYFNIDPTLMRLIFAEIAFFTALVPAFIVYLIMAMIIPQAPENYYALYQNNSKRIYKSNDRKLAGVCGGIADYMNVDSTLVRLLFVLLFLLFGNGIYTYLFGAIFMPQLPEFSNGQAYGGYAYHDANGYSDPNEYSSQQPSSAAEPPHTEDHPDDQA